MILTQSRPAHWPGTARWLAALGLLDRQHVPVGQLAPGPPERSPSGLAATLPGRPKAAGLMNHSCNPRSQQRSSTSAVLWSLMPRIATAVTLTEVSPSESAALQPHLGLRQPVADRSALRTPASRSCQGDIDPVESGCGQRRRQPVEAHAVGGHHDHPAVAAAQPTRHELDKTADHQRITSGSPAAHHRSAAPGAPQAL